MTAPAAGLLKALAAIVVKDGVGLGGLPDAQQTLALALVWAGLPEHAVMDEPRVNQLLKAQLAGPAAFLSTDHVELRRWLVDAGWLARDGFGREYRRVGRDALAEQRRVAATALTGIDASNWAVKTRLDHRARREARRRAWQAGGGAAA